MSRSINRLKANRQYRKDMNALEAINRGALDDIAIHGADASEQVKTYGGLATGAVSEILSQVEASKKKAEQAKYLPLAKEARAKADAKASEARYARMEADATEKEPYGPKHQNAERLANEAAKLDADARDLEMKAGIGSPMAMVPAGHDKPFVFPTWAKWAAGGVGALLVGTIIWKMAKGGRR